MFGRGLQQQPKQDLMETYQLQLAKVQEWTIAKMSALISGEINFLYMAQTDKNAIIKYLALAEIPYKSVTHYTNALLQRSSLSDEKKLTVLTQLLAIKDHNLRVEILWGCLGKKTCLGAFFFADPNVMNQIKESSSIMIQIEQQLTLGILKLNKLDMGEAILPIIKKSSHLQKLVKEILTQLINIGIQKYPQRPLIPINPLWMPVQKDSEILVQDLATNRLERP